MILLFVPSYIGAGLKSVESSSISSSNDPCERVPFIMYCIMTYSINIVIVATLTSLEQHSSTVFPGRPATDESTNSVHNTTLKGTPKS